MEPINETIFPPERSEKLKAIYRFSMFDTMFYRSNLWMHTHRILWMIEEIAPVIKETLPNLDIEKARTLALVHDDAEMITGDVQLGHKLRMTEEQLAEIEENERKAVDELAAKYPETVNGYSYKELLLHALHKDCIEAHLVSYIDKVDAYCESIHELFGGNLSLLRSALTYVVILNNFTQKFPDLAPFIESKKSPIVSLNDRVSPYTAGASRYAMFNAPFTEETVKVETELPFYNLWKNIVLARSPEGMEWLTKQKEFLTK